MFPLSGYAAADEQTKQTKQTRQTGQTRKVRSADVELQSCITLEIVKAQSANDWSTGHAGFAPM
jgi:hypothetical protein